jgi:hypothetical protein
MKKTDSQSAFFEIAVARDAPQTVKLFLVYRPGASVSIVRY